MRKVILLMALVAIVALSVFTTTGSARADETKFVGVITKIEITGKDAKTATVTLKENKTTSLRVITVNDELTLDKIKDKRIAEGDEIRCKYLVVDDKNVSILFRKTAGC